MRTTNLDKIALPWFGFGLGVALLTPQDALEIVPGLKHLTQLATFVAPKLSRVAGVSQFPVITTVFFSVIGLTVPLQIFHLYALRHSAFDFLLAHGKPRFGFLLSLTLAITLAYLLILSPGPTPSDIEYATRGNYSASIAHSRVSLAFVGTAVLFLFSVSIALVIFFIEAQQRTRKHP